MSLKFCDECSALLKPTTATGELIFHCICKKIFNSTPEDSLRSEEHLETHDSGLKYEVLVSNSPHDTAGKKVLRECTKCGAPYLTMLYIGANETPLYVCSCGETYGV